MSMPTQKPLPPFSVENLWRARWKYSDPKKGEIIERALMTGRLAIKDDVIFSVTVTSEDLNCNPNGMTLKSVNLVNIKTTTTETADYISEPCVSMSDLGPYIKLRDEAFKTIRSIMKKLRTPILVKSQQKLKITPCEVDETLDCDIATIDGDLTFQNIDFQVSDQLSTVIQGYHDAESILLKNMCIPATFLSRSSGMGQGEVDDASALDDLLRERELAIRKSICDYLKITVEWNIPIPEPKEVVNNDNRNVSDTN